MNPPIASLTIPNMTVNGVALGAVQLSFGAGGLTQFGDPTGNVQVNTLSQNGSAAGTLQNITVSDQGNIVGSFSNGRTVELAQITLASFAGQDFLKKVDGGAFAAIRRNPASRSSTRRARSSAARSRPPTPTSRTNSPG